MVPRILVPLDGSSFGEAALLPAVAIARKSGGDLRLMSAHESDRTPTLAAVCTGLLEGRKE
jgi:nucleotide-binding universal stress UspA family protein